jgi:hypothetical protein
MAKFEFVIETNVITKSVVYFTRRDDLFVENSLSHSRDKAYDRFVNLSCGVKTSPVTTILETRYSLTQ